jgi:hypothetical protein
MSDVIKVISVGPPEYRDLSPGGEAAEGRSVVVWLGAAEIARLLAAYSPQNTSSPLAGDCRPLVREVLDAFLAEQP